MKTKKLWYGLLVGVASVWLAYACQNDVAPVEKAGQEAGTALVDKAKACFESAIRQQVYTRGVADVYEESQEAQSGFIPSDYTPMWSRSFVAEEGNWKQVAAPVATFDKSYICTPDGEVDELAQAVVYREEAGETSCRMLVLWATDGRDAQTAVESFVGNAGQADFTGVAWYLSLDGQVEKIGAYENGRLIADTFTRSGREQIELILEDVVILKPDIALNASSEEVPGTGPWPVICERCGTATAVCVCCVHYPYPTSLADCSICRNSTTRTYCIDCGWSVKYATPGSNCVRCGGDMVTN